MSQQAFPVFVKPIIPKQFAAAVYGSADAINTAASGLASDVEVFVSEIVTFEAEARAFVLEGRVQECALYEGHGSREDATRFAGEVCSTMNLPRTCVVDVGKLTDGTWALIEFNAAWGAGLNGCDATRVIDCIVAASSVAE
jgi:hypothetical protein